MMKIAAMEMMLTTLKSRSVTVIRSLVQGASPMSMPFLSYFFNTALISSTCRLTSSDATLYRELTSMS